MFVFRVVSNNCVARFIRICAFVLSDLHVVYGDSVGFVRTRSVMKRSSCYMRRVMVVEMFLFRGTNRLFLGTKCGAFGRWDGKRVLSTADNHHTHIDRRPNIHPTSPITPLTPTPTTTKTQKKELTEMIKLDRAHEKARRARAGGRGETYLPRSARERGDPVLR
jgi:hypothetical protein